MTFPSARGIAQLASLLLPLCAAACGKTGGSDSAESAPTSVPAPPPAPVPTAPAPVAPTPVAVATQTPNLICRNTFVRTCSDACTRKLQATPTARRSVDMEMCSLSCQQEAQRSCAGR